MSYYKIINGIKMDGHLVDKADHAVAVSVDGRISRKDAEAIVVAVTYGFGYNDVEEDTLNYIRENYKWSEGTEAWFRNQIKIWGGLYKLPMGTCNDALMSGFHKSGQ